MQAESEEESDEPLLESTRGSARDWRGRPPCGGPRACLPAAAAAIVLLTLLLAEGGGPHVDPRRRRRAARASGSKDGVTQLDFAYGFAGAASENQDLLSQTLPEPPSAGTTPEDAAAGEPADEDGLAEDPDGAGEKRGPLDQFRKVDPHEPYAKLMLPPGMSAATNANVERSTPMLPTEVWRPLRAVECGPYFQVPQAPSIATEYNGMALPDACFTQQPATADGQRHVYLIGDWGGLPGPFGWNATMRAPAPADHRSPEFPSHQRDFVWGADDCAQRNVADQMAKRAVISPPDYILNVGDNFYWGGINIKCGAGVDTVSDITSQWEKVFENVYTGPGIDGRQWLGVLGNHDFGGFMFVSGWDQALHYTWLQEFPSTNRWVTPALYYQSKVVYPDFSVDYYFVDTNVWDTWLPHAEQRHNLCSRNHNPPNLEANCGAAGPVSVDECPDWFKSLWKANVEWMDNSMPLSEAEWQIVVTHFPPEGNWGGAEWARLSAQHGIDLILAGHRHRQEVHTSSQIAPTTYVVSGGGGGITSENLPDAGGDDDEYGFVDITLSRSEIMLELISHGGMIRSTTCITPRDAGAGTLNWLQEPSLCEGRPSGPQRPTQTSTTPAPPTGGDWGGDAAALPSDSDLVYSEPGPELYGPEPYPAAASSPAWPAADEAVIGGDAAALPAPSPWASTASQPPGYDDSAAWAASQPAGAVAVPALPTAPDPPGPAVVPAGPVGRLKMLVSRMFR